jgi:hypothetical protein
VDGYTKRYVTTYADFAIENVMTEGIFPTLLHPDPRYFRRHEGTRRSRLGYAVRRLFITRTDSGRNQFNYSASSGESVGDGERQRAVEVRNRSPNWDRQDSSLGGFIWEGVSSGL